MIEIRQGLLAEMYTYIVICCAGVYPNVKFIIVAKGSGNSELSGYLLPCFTLISSQLIRFNVALLFGLTTQYKFVLCYFL